MNMLKWAMASAALILGASALAAQNVTCPSLPVAGGDFYFASVSHQPNAPINSYHFQSAMLIEMPTVTGGLTYACFYGSHAPHAHLAWLSGTTTYGANHVVENHQTEWVAGLANNGLQCGYDNETPAKCAVHIV